MQLHDISPGDESATRLLDYSVHLPGAEDLSKPPIWIGIVGERAIYPLSYRWIPDKTEKGREYLYERTTSPTIEQDDGAIEASSSSEIRLGWLALHPLFWIFSGLVAYGQAWCSFLISALVLRQCAALQPNATSTTSSFGKRWMRSILTFLIRRTSVFRLLNLDRRPKTKANPPGPVETEEQPPYGPGIHAYILSGMLVAFSAVYIALLSCTARGESGLSFKQLVLARGFLASIFSFFSSEWLGLRACRS